MIGQLKCWCAGKHLKGKLVSKDQTHKRFACPRCGRETTYPVKQKEE